MESGSIQRICCIGAGYVGGPTSAVIAQKNPDIEVTVVDYNTERIEAWKSDQLPIFEPGLFEIVKEARDSGENGRKPNLFFSTDVDSAIARADLILVCVNTPTKVTGVGAGRASDLGYVEAAIRKIAEVADTDKIVVSKSTVPCGTADHISEILVSNGKPGVNFEVLSNPEFLAEGTAVSDLLFPDRVLIGSATTDSGLKAAAALANVYASWVQKERLITMSLWSCELSKLAANALLAQRISSINALSAICESTGASVEEVAFACGLDRRIGSKMLQASVGFGGSCFKKDILSLAYVSEGFHLPEVANYWRSVVDINEYQKDRFVKRILESLHHTLSNKRLAVLGFSYKKNTGDTRETAAVRVITSLVAENAKVCIYDPRVKEAQIWQTFKEHGADVQRLKERVEICSSAYEACANSYAVIILTEWDEFNNRQKKPPMVNGNGHAPNTVPLVSDFRAETNGNLNGYHSSHSGETDDSSIGDSESSGEPHVPAQEVPSTDGTASKLDWSRVAKMMKRPRYVFDGRNVTDAAELKRLGFRVACIGNGGTGPRSDAIHVVNGQGR